MKPAIKKLKTCTYSKDRASSAAAFGQREPHTNKLVCDHAAMKLNWNEKVCGPCTVYENRNAELVAPVPQPPQPAPQPPARAASPAPVRQPSPVVTAPPVSPARAVPTPAEAPKKTVAQPANKPTVAVPAPVAPPAKSATRANAPVREAKASADPKAKGSAKPRATKEQPQKSAKKTATKPKQK